MKYNQNLAYEYSRFEKSEDKPKIQQIKGGRKVAKKPYHALDVAKVVFIATIFVLTLSALICTRVTQTELSEKYNTTIKELNTVKGENARLLIKIEEELNIDTVEQYARDELNMEELDSSKVEYIAFNSTAKAIVAEEDDLLVKIGEFCSDLIK